MSWYSRGTDEVKKAVERQEEARANQPPKRIWVKPNTEVEVTYLDEVGFSFVEHALEMPGRKVPVLVTCPKAIGKRCRLCEAAIKSSFVTLYTVIDHSVWVDRDNKEHKNEKKIHALKHEAALTLTTKQQRWGGLVGKRVIVARGGQRDYSSGSDFEMKMINGKPVVYRIDNTKPEHQAFDYERFYAPKSDEEIQDIMRQCGIGSSAGTSVGYGQQSYQPQNGFSRPNSGGVSNDDFAEMIDAPSSPGATDARYNDDSDVPF